MTQHEHWKVEIALDLPEGGVKTCINDPHHEDPMDLAGLSFLLCAYDEKSKNVSVKLTLLGGPVVEKNTDWFEQYNFICHIFKDAIVLFERDELGTVSAICKFCWAGNPISWELSVRQSIRFLERVLRISLSHLRRKVSGNNELLVNRLSY